MVSWIENAGKTWKDLDLQKLNIDEAFIRIKSELNEHFWLYTLNEDCVKCPYTRTKEIHHKKDNTLQLNVAKQIKLKIFDHDIGNYDFDNVTSICQLAPDNLGEFGVYNLTIDTNRTCTIQTDKEPVSIYLSMLLVFLIILTGIILIKLSVFVLKKLNAGQGIEQDSSNEEEIPKTDVAKKRLRSLDCFRGMSIVLMIFVNSGAGGYWWLEHAPWNGLHLADIVFPSFLWIMGVCIPMSIRGQLNRGTSKFMILRNILWRSIKLFAIGLCLNSVNGPTFEDLRIMGVLQRFSIGYLVAAGLYVIFVKSQTLPPQSKIKRIFFDIIETIPLWIVAWILIGIYLGLTFALEFDDCPKGYLGPGGRHDMGAYRNCIGGAIGYIDRTVLGIKHIYQHPTAHELYDSGPFDPEGLMGCLLTCVQVIVGIQCGTTLIIFVEWKSRIKRWLSWSLFLGLFGGILCLFSRDNGWIPINKNLWSLSFILVTSSIAFVLLSLCYYIVDIKQFVSGSPFVEAGMNAILMYMGHEILHKMLPWHWKIGLMNTHFLQLIECLWNTTLWILIALYLHSKSIFFSL